MWYIKKAVKYTCNMFLWSGAMRLIVARGKSVTEEKN